MKRFSAGLVLMLLCTFSIFAQNKVITVSGRVVESDTKEPAAQATVQLLSLPDSAYAAGIASSNQGWFTLPKVKAGKYVLKVSYIGFRTKLVPVQLSANATDKKLGTITLDPDAVMLKEAVITAEAPPVTVKADTTEYSAAAYPVPEGIMHQYNHAIFCQTRIDFEESRHLLQHIFQTFDAIFRISFFVPTAMSAYND